MKFKCIAFSVFFALLISSCSVVDDLLTFDISNQASIKIKSNSPIDLPYEIIIPDVTTNSSVEFKNNNTNAVLVKDVKLRSLKITIESPEEKTFSFLKSIHLYISTPDYGEIELAYLDNISSASNTLELICTDKKLDQYIKADSFKLRTKVTMKETLTQDVNINTDMQFRVTADPF